jgi:hypothetical protein
MGMTAARLRERRALAIRNAPPPRPIVTEEQIQQARLNENKVLRTENAALKLRLVELAAQVSELEKQIEVLTAPPVTPQDFKKQRRGG